MTDRRWGINIDVEGFSNLYESGEDNQTRAILGLSELMHSIIQLGIRVFPGSPISNESDRLFSHQFGDGFIIVSDYEESDAGRAIAIAVALMRHMLINGFATKAAISTGSMSDISGCYPNEMRDAKGGILPMGAGLMTSIPVMGTALTKAHKLGSRASGCVLIVDKTQFSTLPSDLVYKSESNLSFINWRSDINYLAKGYAAKAGLQFGTNEQLNELFDNYVKTEPCPPQKWIAGSQIEVST
ncbi:MULTISPECIES: hypothetical protein [unclassified Aeromonas]|uniref:hypothetical protein n=1 Tax=Aeromonas TaxID=642 RepID=UPI001C228661|nr:hypothetical protein [Aeromonas sp. FDAARGOS 1416]QXB03236.1 hypothetical protein I6L46_07820 [Aeromonas sp. FDAARGOS 1416]